MVVYYIKKEGESLADYRYPIKEGDICMLYDGEIIKTVYIDSELDPNSIWRDFKFIDTKSLKSYQFPTSDSILCAPIGDKHAIGDTGLLTQLIKECKGEWLLDFLNETSAVLSGFVDYWDLGILSRFIGDNNLEVAYENEESLSEFLEKPEENDVIDEYDEEEDADDANLLPKSYDVRWFCLSALSCLEGQLDKRSYQILYDTLNGDSRSNIALKYGLTQERIRQIVVKATKQAKELLIEQRSNLEKEKENNARLNVQLNLMREDLARLKALLPEKILPRQKESEEKLDTELVKLLETPLDDITLPARPFNILIYMGVRKFVEIPQIGGPMQLLNARNSGKKTVHDISRMLEDFGLTFGMTYTEVVNVLNAKDWHTAKNKWIKENTSAVKQKLDVVPTVYTFKDNKEEIESTNKEEASIILTKEIIESARTPNGGFTKSQLAAIGIAWPPPQDWIEKTVGAWITPTQLEAFRFIKYVKEPSQVASNLVTQTYNDVAYNPQDKRRMEAILQAMTNFLSPVTPNVVASTIDPVVWGKHDRVSVDTVDSILKRLPEVEYVKWGKYILKSRNSINRKQEPETPIIIKKTKNASDDKRIGYTIRLFPSQLKGEIVRVRIDSKGKKKLVVKTTKGEIVEVNDLPYLYEVLKRN